MSIESARDSQMKSLFSTEGDLKALEQKCTKEGDGKILTKGLYQQLK